MNIFVKNKYCVMMCGESSKKVIVVYCLEERLNINQVECLKKCLQPFMEQSGIHLVLDLSRVCFMDCAMLGFLLFLHQQLLKKGSLLSLSNLNRFVELLVVTSKTERIIHIIKKNQIKNMEIWMKRK